MAVATAPQGDIDLWAPVARDALPKALVDAMEQRDWTTVRAQLGTVMDGITTDGVYGRALLQLALDLPVGTDPIFDSYRAAASIDHGDWDGLRRCLAGSPVEPIQLLGMRDVLLAPLNQVAPKDPESPYAMLFAPYEYQLSQMNGGFRRWARAMLTFQATELVWARLDVPAGRHIRQRRLQDAVSMAFAEVEAGRLPTAMAFALEAPHLGGPNEPLRLCAPDLEELIAVALGDERAPSLRLLSDLAKPTGLSPLGALQVLLHFLPLLSLVSGDTFLRSARIAEEIAAGLGSARAQLASHAWRVTAEYLKAPGEPHPELPGLRAQASRAGVGLRVLPQLLAGIMTRRPADLAAAEALARRAGNRWAQVTALTWTAAHNPNARVARWLAVLLETTGWRRPILVPAEVAADAALGVASLGVRSQAIVELASAAGRPNILLDVSLRHVDDTAAPLPSRLAAVEALGTLGTSRSAEILVRLARRNDELGRRARLVSERQRRTGLSEREVEVLQFAGSGLTNREIAERLSLSQHTIARHLANARAKLGAANRTEAAVKLEELEGLARD
ncbi:MAG: LuxR C-terminal-related transcriptional regulator [Chloroflexota bacterium]|nr:LuxR C-terminal-related transcriptional regulator [Chloroflexota bacterium]